MGSNTLRTKKCKGLYTAANRLDVPEGALVQANNITIRRDGVIQPRWGADIAVANMLVSGVQYWHRLENFNDYLITVGQVAGTYVLGGSPMSSLAAPTIWGGFGNAPSGGANYANPVKPFYDVEMFKTNGCLYYNGDTGLYRVADTTGAAINRAGGSACVVSSAPRPLSVALARSGTTTVTATTAIRHGYVVGLVVKLTSAGNGNFGTGERTIVTVPSPTTFTYVDATSTATATLAAQTIAANQYVGSSGSFATNDQAAYRAVIVSYDVQGNEYIGEVSGRLEMFNASPAIGAGNLRNAQVAVLFAGGDSIPASSKVQLYRSKVVNGAPPSDEMFKVYERFVTEAERLAGIFWVTPEATPDTVTGQSLYTNSAEQGADHNNLRPAASFTTALWGDMVVQGNTLDYPSLDMQLLSCDGTAGGLSGNNFVCFNDNAATTYFCDSSSPAYTDARQFSYYTGGTASQDVKNTVLSMIDTINWNAASTPLVNLKATFSSVSGDWPGRFLVQYTVPDTLGPNDPIVKLRTAATTPDGIADTGYVRNCWAPALGVVQQVTATGVTRTSGVAVISLPGAVANFKVGEYVIVYSNYASQTKLVIGATTVEGIITAVGLGTGTITITNAGSDGTGGTAGAICTLRNNPTFQSGWNNNRIKVSRHKAVEAFPAFTTLDVGQPNSKILKMVPCGTSLLVFKEDGLFRVIDTGGDNEPVLAAQLIDPTCVLWAKDTAIQIHNQVMAWTTKGVGIINEQGVQKFVSEPIYDLLQPQVFQTLPYTQRAFATAIPTDDAYELRIPFNASPSAPFPSTLNLTYNTFTDTWVTDDLAVIGETVYQGARYITQSDGALYKETTTALGISGVSNKSYTFSATAQVFGQPGNRVYTLAYTGTTPPVGSKFVLRNSTPGANYTSYVIADSGTVLTFYTPGAIFAPNLGGLGSNTITSAVEPVVSTVEWAPITFTDEGRVKFFSEYALFFGLDELPLVRVATATDLIPAQETATTLAFRMGNQIASPTNNVFTSAPVNVRNIVPQQHRRGQLLRIIATLTCARSPWALLGVAVTGMGISSRLAK